MFEKLKIIYSFLYKEAVKKEKTLESDYRCILHDNLIEPKEEFEIDGKKVSHKDIRDSYSKLDIPYTRIREDDIIIGELNKEYDIAFRCIRIDKFHYPNRSKDGYAVEYWVFSVDRILNSPQDLTPHHLDLLPENTIHEAIIEEDNHKKKVNGKKIVNTIKKLKEVGVDPTFIRITNELNLERTQAAGAIFTLGENNKIYWDNDINTVDDDDVIRLIK